MSMKLKYFTEIRKYAKTEKGKRKVDKTKQKKKKDPKKQRKNYDMWADDITILA